MNNILRPKQLPQPDDISVVSDVQTPLSEDTHQDSTRSAEAAFLENKHKEPTWSENENLNLSENDSQDL